MNIVRLTGGIAIGGRSARYNPLPSLLSDAIPGDLSFRDVDKHNWREISCRKDARFINEAQLRTYLLDYLLNEIKDPRIPIYAECSCYRGNERNGIADYFVCIGNKWIPVEAKLNILTEQDLMTQLKKYIHIDTFSPILGQSIGELRLVPDNAYCIVFDQSGMYITKEGEYIECSIDQPFIKREDIEKLGMAHIRKQVLRGISE